MLKDPTSLSVMAASKPHPTAVPSDWVCLQHVKVPDYYTVVYIIAYKFGD